MRYKFKKDLVVQQVGDEVFIFDGEMSILHTLNNTAANLFKKLKNGSTLSELGQYLFQEYKIDKVRAMNDSQDFIEKLKKQNLIIEKKSR